MLKESDFEQIQQMFNQLYDNRKNEENKPKPPFHRVQNFGQTNPQRNVDQGQGQQNSVKRNNFACYYCGQPGHYARSCYSNPNRQPDRRSDRGPNTFVNGTPHVQRPENNPIKIGSDKKGTDMGKGKGPFPGFALN